METLTLTPHGLIERHVELDRLTDALAGGVPAVVVGGRQGTGKTALALAFAAEARMLGHVVGVVRGALGAEDLRQSAQGRERPVLIVDDGDRLDSLPSHEEDEFVMWVAGDGRTPAALEGSARVDLAPLTFDGTDRLLDSWLRGPAVTALVAAAHRATGGRPLWLREWIGAARRQGLLERVDGLWTATAEPAPTARSRELAQWATSALTPDLLGCLVEAAAEGSAPVGAEAEVLVGSGWMDRSEAGLVPSVPWCALSLEPGSTRPGRTLAWRARRVPAAPPTGAVLRSLLDGEPGRAHDTISRTRREHADQPHLVADAALSLGLVELWTGDAEAGRWFVEAGLVAEERARAGETGARMARSLANGGEPSALASSGVDWAQMPGDDPWLVNPPRALAWELAAAGDPRAVRVLEEGAIDAGTRGYPLAAAFMSVDAALLDPTPQRVLAARAALDGIPGAWSDALIALLGGLVIEDVDELTRVAAVGLAAERLVDVGDRRVAVEAFRLGGNLARRAGYEREAATLHARADEVGATRGWNANLPAGVLALPVRQRQVVLLAASGRRNQDIADCLTISPRTVENQLHRAFSELAVTSREGLRALIDSGPPDPGSPDPGPALDLIDSGEA